MAKKDATRSNEDQTGPKWTIDITDAARLRGIENANQLWLKIGGSKSTSVDLFNGVKKMIRTDTMDRLQEVLGIIPFEYIKDANARHR